jgi:hypothetical protein
MERQVWLPDENDRHVLAAAIAGSADMIVTLNARDFPRDYLRQEGLDRIDPDALLMQTFLDHPAPTAQLAHDILQVANTFQAGGWTKRALFKKARLPRFAKAIAD